MPFLESISQTISSGRAFLDLRKKKPTIIVVTTGENQEGILKPKDSKSITTPNTKIEYMAPFLRKIYFFILSIFETVIWRTTTAPIPFPIKIKGTDKVKAKAPRKGTTSWTFGPF